MDERQLWTLFLETGDPGVYMMWTQVSRQQGYDNDTEAAPWIDNLERW